ncbi:MAG: DNA alkylation repair protein [Gemmobacter sp.]|nr:DNA alkylation repair protein [Gemmobacter sp.]
MEARADPARSAEMAAYHKAPRRYLGLAVPQIDALVQGWRAAMTLEERIALADTLWQSDVHEARIAAAKLLTQARIRPDDAVWALICRWVPQFDAWAIADHACKAGDRRVMADLARLVEVESWTRAGHMWSRRAALVVTLPLCRLNHPKPAETAARERVLGWAASYVADPDWFIQKAVAWWLRDLSKHDPARSTAFLAEYGSRMKPFARKEAARLLPQG